MQRKLVIKSAIADMRKVENAIESITAELEIGGESYGKILVATMEAVNNAINHGNHGGKGKVVSLEFDSDGHKLTVKVVDEGEGFDYNSVPDPTLPGNIEKIHGRGIFLMTRLADKVNFNKKGNEVILTFTGISV